MNSFHIFCRILILFCINNYFIRAEYCSECTCPKTRTGIREYACDCRKNITLNNCSQSEDNVLILSNDKFILPQKIKYHQIEELHIHDLHVTNLKASFPEKLNNIHKFSLSLSNVQILQDNSFEEMKKVRVIIIKNNVISTINDNAFLHAQKLERLYIQNNVIEFLPNILLQNLNALQVIDITNNTIKKFHIPFLNGAVKLETIDLSDNNINNLSSNSFTGLTQLIEIDLKNNKIQELPEKIFKNLTSLEEINLHNNTIHRIEKDVFENSYNLIKLILSKNRIKNIPEDVFKGLIKITEIDLEENKIQDLPKRMLENLKNLKVIKLENNNIHVIKYSTFINNNKLEEIYLDGNKIKQIDTTIITNLPNLKNISIPKGSLTCDCTLKKFHAIYMKRSIKGNIQCSINNSTKQFCELTSHDFICPPKVFCTKYIQKQKNAIIIGCKIYGDPLPRYTWTHNEEPITNSTCHEIVTTSIDGDTYWSNLSVFDNETNAKDSLYKIEARSAAGQQSFKVRVQQMWNMNEKMILKDDIEEGEISYVVVVIMIVIIFIVSALIGTIYIRRNWMQQGSYSVEINEAQRNTAIFEENICGARLYDAVKNSHGSIDSLKNELLCSDGNSTSDDVSSPSINFNSELEILVNTTSKENISL